MNSVSQQQYMNLIYTTKRDENDNLNLILWQVDDFLFANKDSKECDRIGKQIQDRMTNPLNQLGTIRKFNGVNVEQARYYNHIHCATYIEKIVSHHGCDNLKIWSPPPTPMKGDSKYQADIQTSRGPESINRIPAMGPLLAPILGSFF
jgi:hypothetical protein